MLHGTDEMCSILTHAARWDRAVLLHRSARRYKMSLNSLIVKFYFSFSGLKIAVIQVLQKE